MKFKCELVGIHNAGIKNCKTSLVDLLFQDVSNPDYTFSINAIEEIEGMKLDIGAKYEVEYTTDSTKTSKVNIPLMKIEAITKEENSEVLGDKFYDYNLSSEHVKENNKDYYSASFTNSSTNEFKYGDLVKICIN